MAPKVGRIRKAFRGDERFMMLSAYYREQGYKPVYALRSAFSILIQIPFFLAAYAFLSNLPALRGCPFWVLEDLGSPDGLLRAGSVRVNVLPVVMTVANCVAGYLYTKGHPLREKVQVYGMAGLFLLVLYGSPSGLLVYWTMNNILSLVKNIFYKLRHPAKVLYFLCATASIALVILMLATHTGKPSTQAFLLFGAALVVCIPLELAFLKWVYRRWLTPLANSPRFRERLFLLNMTGCALLLGVVVPSGLIVSSPTEFAFLEPYRNPLAFVGITFCQAVEMTFRDSLMAWGMAWTSELRKTTSAASMAASAPLPMAAPASAPARTGASLIPSPTKSMDPSFLRRSFIMESLS